MIIIIIGLNGYILTIWRKGTIWARSDLETGARFLSLARGEPGLCSADHGAGYFSNLACGWLGIDWLAPGRETEGGPRTWRLLFCKQHHQTHFHYGKYRSLIQVSRIFIPKRPIYNKPALDQIMAWRREADKRLSEAVTVLYTDASLAAMSFRGYYHILYHFTHVLCLCALKTRRFIQYMQSPMFWFVLVSLIILYRTLVTCCLFVMSG